MSVSPPKDGEGAGDASPENSDTQMERGEEAQAREAYDFDVKEQDRWLPIANGGLQNIPSMHSRLSYEKFELRVYHLCDKLHDDARMDRGEQGAFVSLVREAGLACATSTGFLSPQSKDLRQHLFLHSLWSSHTSLSGRSSCPEFPRLHHHRELVGLQAMFLMLIYETLLQLLVS